MTASDATLGSEPTPPPLSETETDEVTSPEVTSAEVTSAEVTSAEVTSAEVTSAEVPAAGLDLDADAPEALVRLADAMGVATSFEDWQGRESRVGTRTIVAVLTALEVDCSTPQAIDAALVEIDERPWLQLLPDVVIARGGRAETVLVHAEAGAALRVWLDLEDGARRDLKTGKKKATRRIGEVEFAQVSVDVPDDVPLGWHTINAQIGDGETETRPLVVTPQTLALPEALQDGRSWGFMTQLYSVRSRASWSLGDLADLAELATWSAREHGADFVLVNPLHAAEPLPPMSPSPYLPTTRRFANPIYLRVEDVREMAYLPSTERAIIEWQADPLRRRNTDPGLLDRDAVWAAKRSALWAVFQHPRSPARQLAFHDYCEREGQGLQNFALWCALADYFGLPVEQWPADVRHPSSDAVLALRGQLAPHIEFHLWMQWCLDEQLRDAQRAATESGMALGVVHDLAVGVHPQGADVWTLGPALARGVTVGCPPDAFNQVGQDWSQPPWRPDQLSLQGYAPFRDMVRTVLRHAGGLRVDHIIGLFRLWWIPEGETPDKGTYVRYDHEALIGILALEAQRAGAVVIGEDLGTVEPWVRVYLKERGVFGTSILWYEKDGEGVQLPPDQWRELCLATVTTHDLPPTAGYLDDEHLLVRERLGVLTRPLEQEREESAADRAQVFDQISEMGLLGPDPTERQRVEALHTWLLATPSRLIGVALADAVGDRRTMNQPGTSTEYPNWQLPLADGAGTPVLLDDLVRLPRAASLAHVMSSQVSANDGATRD